MVCVCDGWVSVLLNHWIEKCYGVVEHSLLFLYGEDQYNVIQFYPVCVCVCVCVRLLNPGRKEWEEVRNQFYSHFPCVWTP